MSPCFAQQVAFVVVRWHIACIEGNRPLETLESGIGLPQALQHGTEIAVGLRAGRIDFYGLGKP